MQLSDREFIAPPGVTLRVDGCEVTVTPIVVAEVFDLLALVEPVFDELMLMDAQAFEDRVQVARLPMLPWPCKPCWGWLSRSRAPSLAVPSCCTSTLNPSG